MVEIFGRPVGSRNGGFLPLLLLLGTCVRWSTNHCVISIDLYTCLLSSNSQPTLVHNPRANALLDIGWLLSTAACRRRRLPGEQRLIGVLVVAAELSGQLIPVSHSICACYA